MARFFGKVRGGRGEATRVGHKFLVTNANGWAGGVRVQLDNKDGIDYARISLTEGSGHAGNEVVIYEGRIDLETRQDLIRKAEAINSWKELE